MTNNLMLAHNQWATRPPDQRFDSLEEMYTKTYGYYLAAAEAEVGWKGLRVEEAPSNVWNRDDNLYIRGASDRKALVSHYAFGQIAARVGAPAGYLRSLPPELAVKNLNHGLSEHNEDTTAKLLFRDNGTLTLRAATSTRYARIWNWEIIQRLQQFADYHHLIPAQSTFTWGQGGPGQVEAADLDETAEKALYASEHDMFAFMMSNNTLLDPLGKSVRRGIIVVNSEVGDKSLGFYGFLFRGLCCNHIIWGVDKLSEVRIRHTGDISGKFGDAVIECRKYLDGSTTEVETMMRASTRRLGDTKEEVLDRLFNIRTLGISRKALNAGYEAVNPDEDGDPRSAWGLVQGLTRESQKLPYAEERAVADRAAGKILQITF
jgi:hypothetical protein